MLSLCKFMGDGIEGWLIGKPLMSIGIDLTRGGGVKGKVVDSAIEYGMIKRHRKSMLNNK